MYLEKLEVQGFKSFANKNILVFPGMIDKSRRGLTSVVGPNGSGKSNIADAVRWVLGEQSMKTLRGKKSEDIIFSGSDKKGKLGMAEVSLFLNNEDSKNKNSKGDDPINYSQIVLTRRLFRSGDSEYLINNSRVRLSDIQILLAKANFGQKTYSVIGQGMVDGFLNTGITERKEFFDEATGVKQFQIKRDNSLQKLRSGYENLNQVSMLLTEIEPRLRSLTRQVDKLKKRGALKEELEKLQVNYYRKIWHEINDRFNEVNGGFLEIEKERFEREKKLEQFNRELKKMEDVNKKSEEFEDLRKKSLEIQEEKDNIIRQLATINAQIEIKLESQGKFDLAWLKNKEEELRNEIKKNKDEEIVIEKEIDFLKKDFKKIQDDRENINLKIINLNKELNALNLKNEEGGDVAINEELKKYLEKIESLNENSDINDFKKIINEIKESLEKAIKNLNHGEEREKIKEIQNKIIRLTEEKEEITAKINEYNLKISTKEERKKILKERMFSVEGEIKGIENKLKDSHDDFNDKEYEIKKEELKKKLELIENRLLETRERINFLSSNEEKEREKIFSIQRDIQNLQNEINNFNTKLSELKINSTRFETKLEDLENEIRNNLGNLKKIREKRNGEELNRDQVLEKINQLKKQLDLIGGIDKEAENEYLETKERYDFLSGQVNDLKETINSLEKIIKDLDGAIKEKFDKEFKIISEKFEEYFKILFNGGSAKIIKVIEKEEKKENESEEENLQKNEKENIIESPISKIKFLQKHNAIGLSGIEIQATPPGKKIKSISVLSGGERALVAIALICAIISANPSPFVVLDEVDAALDEANSERFAKILDDLSYKTQFIVVTHNRASMRRANILYGVTMGDDGISKLLSVKLEDVKKRN